MTSDPQDGSASAARIAGAPRPVDFHGQVAVVTGAGRGLGRAYARLLASLGASVVVNDVGMDVWGAGAQEPVADTVVREIEADGGRAVASTASVATEDGGRKVVSAAVEAFGRVDVVVHNAGIRQTNSFLDTSVEELHRVLETNLLSAWYVGQPAWRLMMDQGYGRIVFTSSASLYGLINNSVYMAAKSGLIGLTRGLAAEAIQARNDEVKVNSILPVAATRMSTPGQRDLWKGLTDPAEVAPVVAYLASRNCRVSGNAFATAGTHVAQTRMGLSRGWARGAPGVSADEVEQHFDDILDECGAWFPDSCVDYLRATYQQVTGSEMPVSADPAVGMRQAAAPHLVGQSTPS